MFQGEASRTEYVNEIPVSLSRGYYISPFIRANYVLKRVFAYFGYELKENFFTRTEPFSKMVLVNNEPFSDRRDGKRAYPHRGSPSRCVGI